MVEKYQWRYGQPVNDKYPVTCTRKLSLDALYSDALGGAGHKSLFYSTEKNTLRRNHDYHPFYSLLLHSTVKKHRHRNTRVQKMNNWQSSVTLKEGLSSTGNGGPCNMQQRWLKVCSFLIP